MGIWVVASPFALGFGRNHAAMWSNVAVGLTVILLALASLWGEETIQAAIVPLGVWLFASAFVLGFSSRGLFWSNVVMAFLVVAGALVSEGLRPGSLPGKPPRFLKRVLGR
jgi:hypothetical protein